MIAATSRDLKEEVSAGKFREDLYYRINVFPVSIPPLRKRTGDIPQLVRHFVEKYARKSSKKIETVPKDMVKTLQRYSWPGNVRKLEHVIERAVIITEGPALQIFDTFQPLKAHDAIESEPSPKDMAAIEREHILRVLRETNWIIGGPRRAPPRFSISTLAPSVSGSRNWASSDPEAFHYTQQPASTCCTFMQYVAFLHPLHTCHSNPVL